MSRIEKWRRGARRCSAGFVELLSPYIDGELDAGTRVAVEAHLETCAACRTRHETLRFAARAVARLHIPPSEASEWTKSAELHRKPFVVDAASRRYAAPAATFFDRISNAKISLPVPVAAALVILAAAALFFISSHTPNAPAPTTIVETIEVPVERETVREVVRERVRTRIVYVEREKRLLAGEGGRPVRTKRWRPRVDAVTADDALKIETARRSSLEGFRPATDANLRVVADEDK